MPARSSERKVFTAAGGSSKITRWFSPHAGSVMVAVNPAAAEAQEINPLLRCFYPLQLQFLIPCSGLKKHASGSRKCKAACRTSFDCCAMLWLVATCSGIACCRCRRWRLSQSLQARSHRRWTLRIETTFRPMMQDPSSHLRPVRLKNPAERSNTHPKAMLTPRTVRSKLAWPTSPPSPNPAKVAEARSPPKCAQPSRLLSMPGVLSSYRSCALAKAVLVFPTPTASPASKLQASWNAGFRGWPVTYQAYG